MKKIITFMKVILILGLLVLIFLPSINVQIDAGMAKDPHEHLGDKTLCHNTSNRDCGADHPL